MRSSVKEILGINNKFRPVTIKGVQITPLNSEAEREIRHLMYKRENNRIDDEYVEKEVAILMKDTVNYKCIKAGNNNER